MLFVGFQSLPWTSRNDVGLPGRCVERFASKDLAKPCGKASDRSSMYVGGLGVGWGLGFRHRVLGEVTGM